MSPKIYYDHDAIWTQRRQQQQSVWGRHSLRVYKEILTLLYQFKPNARTLLDIGCGAGAFAKLAAEKDLSYVGIDASQVAISLGQSAYPGVDLRCIDAAQIFEPALGSFDVVTAINSLHCLIEAAHRQNFLRNVALSLQESGVAILTTMCGPLEFEAEAIPVRAYLNLEDIKQELISAGLTRLLFERFEPATDFNLIPNVVLVAAC